MQTNIAKAIIAVMQEVKGIEKSMTVGSGSYSYQGVPDQEVKKVIGESMAKHGLCILPIGIDGKTRVDRWEEKGQYGVQQKQSVFTEVKTKYLLLHVSGESIELEGYGHGVDSQDKGAGKATTYALKYTLLYSFLVPTGKIDDADNHHSEGSETPKTNGKKVEVKKAAISANQFKKLLERMDGGDKEAGRKAKETFTLTEEQTMIIDERLEPATA